MLNFKRWADKRSRVLSPRFNIFIQGFADLSQAFRVINFYVYTFSKGFNEILHLFLHIADVIYHILRVNLYQSDSYGKVLGEKREGRISFSMVFLFLHIYEL